MKNYNFLVYVWYTESNFFKLFGGNWYREQSLLDQAKKFSACLFEDTEYFIKLELVLYFIPSDMRFNFTFRYRSLTVDIEILLKNEKITDPLSNCEVFSLQNFGVIYCNRKAKNKFFMFLVSLGIQ